MATPGHCNTDDPGRIGRATDNDRRGCSRHDSLCAARQPRANPGNFSREIARFTVLDLIKLSRAHHGFARRYASAQDLAGGSKILRQI
jgi:hypothetical protein